MKKNKKALILCSIFILVIICCIVDMKYNTNNQKEFFVNIDDKNISNLVSHTNQEVIRDDYTITLVEYIYDEGETTLFAKFLVKNNVVSAKDIEFLKTGYFGEDNRFKLYIPSGGGFQEIYKFKIEDGNLVIYLNCFMDLQNPSEKICLYDKTSGNIRDFGSDKISSGEFLLEKKVKTVGFEIDSDKQIIISPFSVVILGYKSEFIKDLSFVYSNHIDKIIENGESTNKVDDIVSGGYYFLNNGLFYILYLDDVINIFDIQQIKFNGAIYNNPKEWTYSY